MTMDYDNWLVEQEHNYRGWNKSNNECKECGRPIKEAQTHCSYACFQASFR